MWFERSRVCWCIRSGVWFLDTGERGMVRSVAAEPVLERGGRCWEGGLEDVGEEDEAFDDAFVLVFGLFTLPACISNFTFEGATSISCGPILATLLICILVPGCFSVCSLVLISRAFCSWTSGGRTVCKPSLPGYWVADDRGLELAFVLMDATGTLFFMDRGSRDISRIPVSGRLEEFPYEGCDLRLLRMWRLARRQMTMITVNTTPMVIPTFAPTERPEEVTVMAGRGVGVDVLVDRALEGILGTLPGEELEGEELMLEEAELSGFEVGFDMPVIVVVTKAGSSAKEYPETRNPVTVIPPLFVFSARTTLFADKSLTTTVCPAVTVDIHLLSDTR